MASVGYIPNGLECLAVDRSRVRWRAVGCKAFDEAFAHLEVVIL